MRDEVLVSLLFSAPSLLVTRICWRIFESFGASSGAVFLLSSSEAKIEFFCGVVRSPSFFSSLFLDLATLFLNCTHSFSHMYRA